MKIIKKLAAIPLAIFISITSISIFADGRDPENQPRGISCTKIYDNSGNYKYECKCRHHGIGKLKLKCGMIAAGFCGTDTACKDSGPFVSYCGC